MFLSSVYFYIFRDYVRVSSTCSSTVRDQIVELMTANNFFSTELHGFIKGKSCRTQLLEFLEDITEALDHGKDLYSVLRFL